MKKVLNALFALDHFSSVGRCNIILEGSCPRCRVLASSGEKFERIGIGSSFNNLFTCIKPRHKTSRTALRQKTRSNRKVAPVISHIHKRREIAKQVR